jgi:sulfur-oxidizing protein SoxY
MIRRKPPPTAPLPSRGRRATLQAIGVAIWRGAMAACGGVSLRAHAAAADPFGARSVAEALERLGITDIVDSSAVALDVPDIAENGAVVPVSVRCGIAATDTILVLLEKNPFPLAARYEILEDLEPSLSMRVKMAETADVIALVRADGKIYRARREVKVTIGGCGG